jgi:hypothetical protein
VWTVLEHFGIQASSFAIVQACRYSDDGIPMVAMALALQRFGLQVEFFTDPDENPDSEELLLFDLAVRKRIPVRPAVTLEELSDVISDNRIAVVIYAEDGVAHFSPMLGVKDGIVHLAYLPVQNKTVSEFEKAWNTPGYFRQCILVSKSDSLWHTIKAMLRRMRMSFRESKRGELGVRPCRDEDAGVETGT